MIRLELKNRIAVLCTAIALLVISCAKMDDYKKYLTDGEISYTGKIDSVTIYSGHERVVVFGLLKADPKVVNCLIYWNSKQDSIMFPIVRSAKTDTLRAVITDLPEGVYNFEIYTLDKLGNKSIPVYKSGTSYGERYEESLIDRPVINGIVTRRGTINISWGDIDLTNGAFATEIKYTNEQGSDVTRILPVSDKTSKFLSEPNVSEIQYRTLFVPDSLAIDTFATDYIKLPLTLSLITLDRTKFSEYRLPGDVGPAWGWNMPFMWNGSFTGTGFHTPDGPFPQKFSFDLGVTAMLDEMRIWARQDRIYKDGNPKKWEIWGSTNPAADGSYDGWVKLLDCESIKPSGLPYGQVSQADILAAQAGELYQFGTNSPPVRYIRFKILGSWDPGAVATHIMEVSFGGEF